MLGLFKGYQSDWDAIQEKWGIKPSRRWHDYGAPMHWLAVMIDRTFTSLDVVFDIIRATEQLGPLDYTELETFAKDSQPSQMWTADINLNRTEEKYDTGTFAFWLPHEVSAAIIDEGFDSAARTLSDSFFARLRKTEKHYTRFFSIGEDTLDIDVLHGEKDVRDWQPTE